LGAAVPGFKGLRFSAFIYNQMTLCTNYHLTVWSVVSVFSLSTTQRARFQFFTHSWYIPFLLEAVALAFSRLVEIIRLSLT